MSKRIKVQSIEIPAMYTMLEKLNKDRAERKIVIDATGKVHVLRDKSVPVPIGLEVSSEFKDFSDFIDRGHQTAIMHHEEIFKSPPPKRQDHVTTAGYVWAFWVKDAKPHLAETNLNGDKVRKSTNSDRVYLGFPRTDKTPALPAQALTCHNIVLESLTDGKVTESALKVIVENRAKELKTRQDPWRIFQYYRPKLISLGLLKHN